MTPRSALWRGIGWLVCAVKRKHVWGRAYDDHVGGGITERVKECARCGTSKTVKRRKQGAK